MDNNPNILKFPGRFKSPATSEQDYDDDFDDFESWEAHVQLQEEEDYPGLVKYCEREVSRDPEDLYAQIRLGEAYLKNKQYQEAIQAMGKCYRKNPDIDPFTRIILDALFALDKTEDDYEWIKKPCILTIGPAVLDYCFEYLRPNPTGLTLLH